MNHLINIVSISLSYARLAAAICFIWRLPMPRGRAFETIIEVKKIFREWRGMGIEIVAAVECRVDAAEQMLEAY